MRLVREAIDLGVRVFDTADAYGKGVSEQILGRAIAGHRDDVIVATKVGYRFAQRRLSTHTAVRHARPLVRRPRRRVVASGSLEPQTSARRGYTDQDFSPSAVLAAVDSSLRRLRTDHLDVLQLHDPPLVAQELAPVIDQLKTSGKVMRFGIGAHDIESAAAWITTGQLDVVQLPFGMLDPDAADAVIDDAGIAGVDVWVRGVLGGGVLSGAIRGDVEFARHPKRDLIESLRRLAEGAGLDVFQLAVDFARSRPGVDVVVLGMSTTAQLHRNVHMMSQPIDDASHVDAATSLVARWNGQRERR